MDCAQRRIIDSLLDSYQRVGGINRIDSGNLPSKRAITDVCVVINRSIVVTVLMIESTLGGQVSWLKMTKVPLTDYRRCVIGRLQTLS